MHVREGNNLSPVVTRRGEVAYRLHTKRSQQRPDRYSGCFRRLYVPTSSPVSVGRANIFERAAAFLCGWAEYWLERQYDVLDTQE